MSTVSTRRRVHVVDRCPLGWDGCTWSTMVGTQPRPRARVDHCPMVDTYALTIRPTCHSLFTRMTACHRVFMTCNVPIGISLTRWSAVHASVVPTVHVVPSVGPDDRTRPYTAVWRHVGDYPPIPSAPTTSRAHNVPDRGAPTADGRLVRLGDAGIGLEHYPAQLGASHVVSPNLVPFRPISDTRRPPTNFRNFESQIGFVPACPHTSPAHN